VIWTPFCRFDDHLTGLNLPQSGQDCLHLRQCHKRRPQFTLRDMADDIFKDEGRICLMGDAGVVAPPFTGSGVFKGANNAVDLAEAFRANAAVMLPWLRGAGPRQLPANAWLY